MIGHAIGEFAYVISRTGRLRTRKFTTTFATCPVTAGIVFLQGPDKRTGTFPIPPVLLFFVLVKAIRFSYVLSRSVDLDDIIPVLSTPRQPRGLVATFVADVMLTLMATAGCAVAVDQTVSVVVDVTPSIVVDGNTNPRVGFRAGSVTNRHADGILRLVVSRFVVCLSSASFRDTHARDVRVVRSRVGITDVAGETGRTSEALVVGLLELVGKVFVKDKEVVNINLDPEEMTADVDVSDYAFPRVEEESRFEQFKGDE